MRYAYEWDGGQRHIADGDDIGELIDDLIEQLKMDADEEHSEVSVTNDDATLAIHRNGVARFYDGPTTSTQGKRLKIGSASEAKKLMQHLLSGRIEQLRGWNGNQS
jgi:hypothetical protein